MSVKSRFIAISANAVLNSYYIFTIYQNDLAHFLWAQLGIEDDIQGDWGAEGPVDRSGTETASNERIGLV